MIVWKENRLSKKKLMMYLQVFEGFSLEKQCLCGSRREVVERKNCGGEETCFLSCGN